ncbi:MAG: polysaccharide biosynthesis C-terminal domain-containing protein, partial [Rhodospirillaceae bacterium]|nr:polysaccharide biosynthesis C-terminal domain-containing protein [Rhodospirillaceae bacterium]
STWIMVAGNAVNVVLNLWWIDGGFGVSALGAVGAAWATTVSRTVMCLAAAAWVWFLRDHARFRVRAFGQRHHDREAWGLQRRLGYAAGASIGVEGFAFSTLNVMSGWFGAESLAAYAIGINLLGMVFMVSLGVGGATSVRVGHAIGRGDPRDAEIAGWTGLALNTLLAVPFVMAFTFGPTAIAAIYSNDPAVLVLAGVLVAWIAVILPFDGAQAVMSNALRGCGETWVPLILQGSAYFLAMMPCAWFFSVKMGMGVGGLFSAVGVGCVISAVLLSVRFWWLARHGYDKTI